MDPKILVIAGVSIFLLGMILIPAELQILRERKGQHHLPYAKRDYYWGNKLLNHLVTLGIGLFALYLFQQQPQVIDSLLNSLLLK